jgi:hypothetical protein
MNTVGQKCAYLYAVITVIIRIRIIRSLKEIPYIHHMHSVGPNRTWNISNLHILHRRRIAGRMVWADPTHTCMVLVNRGYEDSSTVKVSPRSCDKGLCLGTVIRCRSGNS